MDPCGTGQNSPHICLPKMRTRTAVALRRPPPHWLGPLYHPAGNSSCRRSTRPIGSDGVRRGMRRCVGGTQGADTPPEQSLLGSAARLRPLTSDTRTRVHGQGWGWAGWGGAPRGQSRGRCSRDAWWGTRGDLEEMGLQTRLGPARCSGPARAQGWKRQGCQGTRRVWGLGGSQNRGAAESWAQRVLWAQGPGSSTSSVSKKPSRSRSDHVQMKACWFASVALPPTHSLTRVQPPLSLCQSHIPYQLHPDLRAFAHAILSAQSPPHPQVFTSGSSSSSRMQARATLTQEAALPPVIPSVGPSQHEIPVGAAAPGGPLPW